MWTPSRNNMHNYSHSPDHNFFGSMGQRNGRGGFDAFPGMSKGFMGMFSTNFRSVYI